MDLPHIFRSLDHPVQEQYVRELLELNEKTKAFGLVLSPAEIRQMMTARNQVLRQHGRLELGIETTKDLIENFADSPFITREHYASTLHELQEIFYYFKNETEDKISDRRLIRIIKDCFEKECEGSLELLKSKLETFAAEFRSNLETGEYGEFFEAGGEERWD